MMEHVFTLAWGRFPRQDSDAGEPTDMTKASAAFMKNEQVAILRSQAIGKPKSGKLKPEPVAIMSNRITVNVDNIAEAALESLLQQHNSESTRQPHAPRTAGCPAEGSHPPKPSCGATKTSRPTVSNNSGSDEDDGSVRARRSRDPEQTKRPSSTLHLEKQNVAPPAPHQCSSSTGTAVGFSTEKHTLSASRCLVPPPLPRTSGECEAENTSSTTPLIQETKKDDVDDELETRMPVAALSPRRGLSSKSENKTRTAGCLPAKERCVGQKRSVRDEEMESAVEETESPTAKKSKKKKRKEGGSRAVPNAAARLVPAPGVESSQPLVDETPQTDAGKLTTARLDGALNVASATAAGNPFCVPPRSSGSSRSTVFENKLVERALKLKR